MPTALFTLPGLIQPGKALMGAWCTAPDPQLADALAREPGYSTVCVDLQHGGYDFPAAMQAIQLITLAGKAAGVRIPVGEFTMASRVLDCGAALVIAPMINTPEDAKQLASFVKYAPRGARSWGAANVVRTTGMTPAEYLAGANAGTLCFAMIETRQALGNIDAILAVDGIDGIFMGPADLSITLSGGKLDPASAEVNDAVRHALERTRAAKKIPAIFAPTGERAREFSKMGYDLISIGSDLAMLKIGAQQMLRAATAE
ncbi:HpcH/HpaI aldolase family protein [Ramlibacter sp.]|uniref:HpcH/HpaI aldolase family protein n=1 Tax=Ramlibacter sp. TaxID=1917967 RepID=UPI003D0D8220